MNALGIALVWCALQVTLVGLLAGGLYLLVRTLRPAPGTSIPLTGLITIVALSALAISPWPRWSFGGWGSVAAWTGAEGGSERVGPQQRGVSVLPGQRAPAAPSNESRSPASASAGQDVAKGPASQALPVSEACLLQAVVEELAAEASPPAADAWRWPALAAVLFLIATGSGAAWLGVGLWSVRAYRVGSRPVENPELLGLARVLRAALGCRRPIELRQSDWLPAAATIGWRRPILLLPAEWTSWTHEQRRAVLAHEIAHVRARHFLGVLFGQVGLVLHFYHPLVHWLMSRLRLEQELAADAAAAEALGGKQDYLAAVAELALRGADRRMAWLAQSFVPTRTTFLRRIAMLRDAKSPSERASVPTRVLTAGAVLLCGLLVAGLRGPSADIQAFAQDADPFALSTAEAQPAAPVQVQTLEGPEPVIVIRGRAGDVQEVIDTIEQGGQAAPSAAEETAPEPREGVSVLDILRFGRPRGSRPEERVQGLDRAGHEAAYRADFRGAAFDHNTLVPFGFETLYGLQLLKPEPRGLRIVVPFHQGERKPSVGLLPLVKIHGDFEITAGYEILAVEPPKTGAGAGANLYILAEKSLNGASFRRCVNPEGDQIYFVHASVRGEDGKRRPQYKHFPAKTRTGTLCLKRNGAVLQFLVAEGESGSLRKLHQVEFGTDPLGLLRIESTTDGSRTSVETLWKDLAIRAEKLERVDIPLFRDRANAGTGQRYSGPESSSYSPRAAESQGVGSAEFTPEAVGEGPL